MKRYVALFVLMLSVSMAAQQPAPPKTPPQPAKPPAAATHPAIEIPNIVVDASAGGQPVNIRLDVSVADHGQATAGQPKTVMVMLVDRALGRTRGAFEDRSISVDATPTIVDGRIRVQLTIESRTDTGPGKAVDRTMFWQNSFALMLDSGKPMIAFETSDPVTKRKLSIEVKATIQK